MSASSGSGSSPTLAYCATTTSSVPPNTRASSPWRTERYSQTPPPHTHTQAFLLSNLCLLVQVVVSLVNGRPGAQRFSYSPVLQDFTKATNIRLAFLRTNTLLGHLISKAQRDPTVTRRVSPGRRPAVSLSGFPRVSINFSDFVFPAVFLQYQRHQRWGALRLPRPCSGVWWGRLPGQDQRVRNSLYIFAAVVQTFPRSFINSYINWLHEAVSIINTSV